MSKCDPYKLKPKPLLIVISGPSGVGKDATIRELAKRGHPFYFVVTATSRAKRAHEIDGQDYFFVSREEFERMIANNELIEHAVVYGEYKGIPKAQIQKALESGLDVIMRIDVQGAQTIRRLIPDAVLIFMTAASEEELIRRLKGRCTEPEEVLQKRIETARREMEEIDKFDYVVVNRDSHLDETVHQILTIIAAEKLRVKQRECKL